MTPFKSLEQLKAEGWDEDQLYQQRMAVREGADISYLDAKRWTWDRLEAQRYGYALKYDYDFSVENNLDWAETAVRQRDGRRYGALDLDHWTCFHLTEQVLAVNQGLDLSVHNIASWHSEQLHQQRLALEVGYDLSDLDPRQWSAHEMRIERRALIRGDAQPTATDECSRAR